MKVNYLVRDEFLRLVYERKEDFLAAVHVPEAFVVRRFYDPRQILALRQEVFASGQLTEPSWHPLFDGCPDYHRLHDDYPNAHVKSRMHAFYFHGWYPANRQLFATFGEIFAVKNHLAGFPEGAFLDNVPSDGPIARVNFQNYPVGGGHLAEHVDPTSPFALIQTLVQASSWGEDFAAGGLYARAEVGGEKLYLDPLTAPGDLVVLSPGIPHGVEAVDPEAEYDWRTNRGKWTILPIIVASDYPRPETVKPRQLHAT